MTIVVLILNPKIKQRPLTRHSTQFYHIWRELVQRFCMVQKRIIYKTTNWPTTAKHVSFSIKRGDIIKTQQYNDYKTLSHLLTTDLKSWWLTWDGGTMVSQWTAEDFCVCNWLVSCIWNREKLSFEFHVHQKQ